MYNVYKFRSDTVDGERERREFCSVVIVAVTDDAGNNDTWSADGSLGKVRTDPRCSTRLGIDHLLHVIVDRPCFVLLSQPLLYVLSNGWDIVLDFEGSVGLSLRPSACHEYQGLSSVSFGDSHDCYDEHVKQKYKKLSRV